MLEDGRLTEGHGRALLLAPEQSQRRALGRQAVEEGWSVREVERRARPTTGGDEPVAAAPKPPAVRPSADHIAAAEELSDELSVSLGLEVRVKPHGKGFRVELDLDDMPAARRLTDRLA